MSVTKHIKRNDLSCLYQTFSPLKAEFGKIINEGGTKGHTTSFDKVFYPIRLKFLRLLFKKIIVPVAFYGLKICVLIGGNTGLKNIWTQEG
jgi:hypothetical protein